MNQTIKQYAKTIAILGAGAVGGALLTLGIAVSAQGLGAGGDNKMAYEEIRAFSNVFGAVKRFYVEPVDDKKLLSGAISGMLADLDPHSAYLDPTSFKQMQEQTAGEFGGLGMEIGNEDSFIKVQTPIEGTPAERAGVRAGDLIIKIEDKSTKNMSTTDAVKLLRGKPGTPVTITISRKGDPVPMSFKLVRDVIKVQSVRSKNLDNGIAYVRVTQFQERTVEDLVRHLNLVGKAGAPKQLILDLRNNPGGLLDASVGVTAAFIPKEQKVVSIRGRDPRQTKEYFTRPSDYQRGDTDPLATLPAWARTVPMVVLINAGSASASEIVAGALRDYGRAKMLGIRSFGKGSVQNIIPLPNEGGIKLTTARYYTPKDISIQAKGIEPDFMVDEAIDGNPFAELMSRESDNERALDNGVKKTQEERNKEADERMRRIEKLRAEGRKPTEYGTPEDFQLQQAINVLLGKPVILHVDAVKTSEGKVEAK